MDLIRMFLIKEINIDLPPEYMTIFLIILSILIIIFVLIIIFLILLYNMMKRQATMRYPIMNKKILRKERRILLSDSESSSKNSISETANIEVDDREKIQKELILKDKEVTTKLAAVVPVRITSHHSSTIKEETVEELKSDDTELIDSKKSDINGSEDYDEEQQEDQKNIKAIDKKPALAKPVKKQKNA